MHGMSKVIGYVFSSLVTKFVINCSMDKEVMITPGMLQRQETSEFIVGECARCSIQDCGIEWSLARWVKLWVGQSLQSMRVAGLDGRKWHWRNERSDLDQIQPAVRWETWWGTWWGIALRGRQNWYPKHLFAYSPDIKGNSEPAAY